MGSAADRVLASDIGVVKTNSQLLFNDRSRDITGLLFKIALLGVTRFWLEPYVNGAGLVRARLQRYKYGDKTGAA